VLVGDQDGGGEVQGSGCVGEGAGVDDQHGAVFHQPDARVTELGELHGPTIQPGGPGQRSPGPEGLDGAPGALSRRSGLARAGHCGPDALDDLVGFGLSDLDELIH
jgi:hypothetical protein